MPYCALIAVVPNRFGMDMPSRAFYEGLTPKRFGTTPFWLLCGPSGRSVWQFSPGFPFPVFPMCHIRSGTNGFAERCSRERASGDYSTSNSHKQLLTAIAKEGKADGITSMAFVRRHVSTARYIERGCCNYFYYLSAKKRLVL